MIRTNLEHEMALFKYNCIAPLLNGTYLKKYNSISAYCHAMSENTYVLPDGNTKRFSHEAFKWWYRRYNELGFDGLYPKPRSDSGKQRVLSKEVQEVIIRKIKENFRKTATSIYNELIKEGYFTMEDVSLTTVSRFVGKSKNSMNLSTGEDMRAFEMTHANDLWQIDTTHGPYIEIDGKKYKTYLVGIIDDASRLIVGYGFYLADNAVNVQLTLKEAIMRYGIPKRIYADNGSPYKNMQLSLICARLGATLIHAQVYHGNQKGKIERTFKTIKEGWMYNIDYSKYHSVEELEKSLSIFINNKNNTVHSVTKKTPIDRFLEDSDHIVRKDERFINRTFLHTIERKVRNDALVSVNTDLYETGQEYIGKRIEIRYEPDMSHVYIYEKDSYKEIFKVNRIDNSKIKRNKPLFSNE